MEFIDATLEIIDRIFHFGKLIIIFLFSVFFSFLSFFGKIFYQLTAIIPLPSATASQLLLMVFFLLGVYTLWSLVRRKLHIKVNAMQSVLLFVLCLAVAIVGMFFNSLAFLFVLVVGVFIAPMLLLISINKKKIHYRLPTVPVVIATVFFLLLIPFLLLSVIYWFAFPDFPQATRFAKLHAAIKNTCLLDPQKLHCPIQLEDIKVIEPKEFESEVKTTQMNYQYDPKTNQYTFVVRYSRYRAVIYDQRLLDTDGLDFRDVRVTTIGQDRIVNPPEYPGPWEFLRWDK